MIEARTQSLEQRQVAIYSAVNDAMIKHPQEDIRKAWIAGRSSGFFGLTRIAVLEGISRAYLFSDTSETLKQAKDYAAKMQLSDHPLKKERAEEYKKTISELTEAKTPEKTRLLIAQSLAQLELACNPDTKVTDATGFTERLFMIRILVKVAVDQWQSENKGKVQKTSS